MTHDPPTHPRPPRHPWRALATTTGTVGLICCVATAGMATRNWQITHRATGPVRQAADTYLRHVTTGRPDTAYDDLCDATRQRWTRHEFRNRTTGPHTVTGYTIDRVTVTTRDARPHGTVTTTLHRRSGAVDNRTLTVTAHHDRWRVCDDDPI